MELRGDDMAKWYGKVGYVKTEETEPGIWKNKATEKPYFGDLLKNISKWSTSNNLNDSPSVSNQISIVADPFAYQNFSSIKYVEFMDAVWEVTSIEPQYPRLILSIGGLWNGERAQDGIADEA
jgi:hypothetical protein